MKKKCRNTHENMDNMTMDNRHVASNLVLDGTSVCSCQQNTKKQTRQIFFFVPTDCRFKNQIAASIITIIITLKIDDTF
jgi:hypothetical protein